jgi:hypothetical protein
LTAPRLTGDQLMLKAKEETRAQDDILESMSKGLEGLKVMGRAIGDESDLQMKLLDNLEDEVDKGNASLKRETARAEYVTRDTNTCWLYITICLLLGLLVGLVAFQCVRGGPRARSPCAPRPAQLSPHPLPPTHTPNPPATRAALPALPPAALNREPLVSIDLVNCLVNLLSSPLLCRPAAAPPPVPAR